MSVSQRKIVSFVQSELNKLFGTRLTVDGYIGPKTIEVLRSVSAIPSVWSTKGKFIGFIQYLTHTTREVEDIAIDGFWGPATENAYRDLLELQRTGKVSKWRDKFEISADKYKWPKYQDLEDFFGPPGTNQVTVKTPYTLKIAWDLDRNINQFTCHKKVVEPIQEAMEEIYKIYGPEEIKRLKLDYWGGCYNYRRMRGGSRLSTHAWGIAIDTLPQEARLRWDSSRATLAKPEYVPFWEAWESVGAVSMGRAKNYDWMHLQFCNL